ncbi:MAG TPA: sulfite oxidase [Vicinamibacteria bacterium]|jgi:sulfite oxidase|nr:sulfite oxidase [Vicinamibacteria bacterium]
MANPPDLRPGLTRRAFLGVAAGVAAFPSIAAAVRVVPPAKRRMLQVNGYAACAETPLDVLTTYLTPNDLFFVRQHWIPVAPDLKNWALTVDGEVGVPLKLSLGELNAMPQTTVTCVLQCAGNGRGFMKPVVPGVQWQFGAVGNARWTGVRVKDVLRKAGLKGTGQHLHTFGTDKPPGKVPPFFRSLEMEKVLEDGVIALKMNGEALSLLHGAPARLVVPGWAGDHWMKWLERLSPQKDPQKGFYMDVGYRFPNKPGDPGVTFKPDEMSPVTELFVKSNITDAPKSARVGQTVTLRGFAFSGAPDISKVEISADGGATWKNAVLDPEHDPYAWRLWTFPWKPEAPGKVTLWARATDSRGSVQPKEAVWNQSGYLYNAWHSADIEVTA